jgi:hypothetical protein
LIAVESEGSCCRKKDTVKGEEEDIMVMAPKEGILLLFSLLSAKILLLGGYKQSLLLFSFTSLHSPVDLIVCV